MTILGAVLSLLFIVAVLAAIGGGIGLGFIAYLNHLDP